MPDRTGSAVTGIDQPGTITPKDPVQLFQQDAYQDHENRRSAIVFPLMFVKDLNTGFFNLFQYSIK